MKWNLGDLVVIKGSDKVDYLIDINNFHGPLDLLLHLVKSKQQDIYEINTSIIIEEYLNYIQNLQSLNIDVASEFLIMAATLIHLKSKMLVGIIDESMEEDNEFEIQNEEDLKNRIIEYEKYKNLTHTFKQLEEKRSEFYTKSPAIIKDFSDEKISNDGSVSLEDLINAFLAYKERISLQKPIHTKVTKKEINVEDRILFIKDKLGKKRKMNFFDLFEEGSKKYIVVTFLAILQMSKNAELFIYQENNFDNIIVEGR